MPRIEPGRLRNKRPEALQVAAGDAAQRHHGDVTWDLSAQAIGSQLIRAAQHTLRHQDQHTLRRDAGLKEIPEVLDGAPGLAAPRRAFQKDTGWWRLAHESSR